MMYVNLCLKRHVLTQTQINLLLYTVSEHCEIKKLDFFEKLNKYRKDKSDENRVAMVKARSAFKTSVKNFKDQLQSKR